MRKFISDLWMAVHGPSASESPRELIKNGKFQGPNQRFLVGLGWVPVIYILTSSLDDCDILPGLETLDLVNFYCHCYLLDQDGK